MHQKECINMDLLYIINPHLLIMLLRYKEIKPHITTKLVNAVQCAELL